MTDPDTFYPHRFEPMLIVISGPSGAGKDTVIQRMKERELPFYFVVTATTRPRREGEVDGVDYIFATQHGFAEMIERGELLEYAYVYNDFKGIPKEQVRKAFASGKDVMMRLDVQGASTIRRLYPEALMIFLTVADEKDLVERLRGRQTETSDELNLRIAMARQELKRIDDFDYMVVNQWNRLDETVDAILTIIQAEHHRVHPRKVTI
jgi:guanylate kinase